MRFMHWRRGLRHRNGLTVFSLLLLVPLVAACSGLPQQTSSKYPDPGISDNEIKLGGSFAFTGPLAATAPLGQGMTAYFKSVNDQGGVNGRKITFITYDDAYIPPNLRRTRAS